MVLDLADAVTSELTTSGVEESGMNMGVTSEGQDPHRVRPGNLNKWPALWDPMNVCPRARKSLWATVALFVAIAQGPSLLQSIQMKWEGGVDFFQDWASARNVVEGRP